MFNALYFVFIMFIYWLNCNLVERNFEINFVKMVRTKSIDKLLSLETVF